MHALVDFHVVSLFSWRALPVNAFSARTLVCPTPAGVKLALLSQLLWRDGPASGEGHLAWLAPLGVAWRPPSRIVVSTATVHIYKSDKPSGNLEPSVGMREFAHMSEPFGLALLDVPDDRRDDLADALAGIRAFGLAESFVQALGPPIWEDALPPGYTLLTEERAGPGEVSCVLDDLGSAPSFERLSAYRPADPKLLPRLGEDRRRLLRVLPLRERWQGRGARVLERVE